MKNPIVPLISLTLCLSAGPSFAQNDLEAMKSLTINALMQYGQNLYDRGDFNEASAVFNRVLTYDGHQAQALQYLKDMGRSPAANFSPNPQMVDVSDTNSLKQAIEAQKQVIGKLQTQIIKMRSDIKGSVYE